MRIKRGPFLRRLIRFCIRPFAFLLFPRIPGSSLKFGPPRHFSETFNEWLANNSSDANAKYLEIFPPITFELTKALCITQKKPKNLEKRSQITLKKQFVAEIPKGRVAGIEPFIITGDDTILGDLSMAYKPYMYDIFFASKLPRLVKLAGPVLIVAGAPGSNYGHWLHQMLPRLELACKTGWKPQDFEKIIINSSSNNFAIESLLALGCDKNQLIQTFPDLHIQSTNLVAPSVPEAGNPPEWISDFLRRTYGKPVSKPSRRIYTSRTNATWRRIANEAQLYPILSEFGFEIIFPDKLNFIDGVRLFENAEVVCGMHGANLANISFCQPGARLIEIYNPQHPETYYWATATGAKLNYSFLLGEGPIEDWPDNAQWASGNRLDTVVCPEKLRDTLIACGL